MSKTVNIPSQIVVQTAAQWAVDATVYSAKRLLIVSDEYYGTSNIQKFKIANGVAIYNNLTFFGSNLDTLYVDGNLIIPSNSIISLTANTNNLAVDERSLLYFDADGNYDLTGIAGGDDGMIKVLYNSDTANIITLKNNVTSSVVNRFSFYPATDVTLNPKQALFIIYADGRWRLLRESIATASITGLLSSTDFARLQKKEIQLACSDETTALTTGTAKIAFRMPYASTITGVRASLSTAQTGGSIFTVDINEAGTSILSTKLTIDNTEKTSTTAATAAVISDSAIADDAEMTIDIDQVGDGTAKGLKVTIYYTI